MSDDPRGSKSRFSSRVDAYAKYRPGYPPAVMELFGAEMGLTPQTVVADVGSGTGISAEPLLRNGNVVYCVEPNPDMRAAAERMLAAFPGFRSVDASGEHTGLPAASVDLVLCAQAFHWLDPACAAAEFRRILRPGGFVALVWNDRRTESSPFLAAYDERLVRYGTDYVKVAHEKSPTLPNDFAAVFGFPFRRASFPSEQRFDLEGLRGRVASASYTPLPGEAGHAELFAGLDELFSRHAIDGLVTFEYSTVVFYGQTH